MHVLYQWSMCLLSNLCADFVVRFFKATIHVSTQWCICQHSVAVLTQLYVCCSCDESATEAILKSVQVYTSLCGELGLSTPRDAFITALCKSSLPPHYALTILNSHGSSQKGRTITPHFSLLPLHPQLTEG